MDVPTGGEDPAARLVPVLESGPGPLLPRGYRLRLAGRGTTFVRQLEGPPGAPTLLLLHGWIASGGLNWFQAFDALGEHFNVVTIDHRGHGRGIRSHRRFRLRDCADDAAALLDLIGSGPVIVVGYSMGGPIGLLLAKRRPDLVDGLVLMATSFELIGSPRRQAAMASMMAAAASISRIGELAGRLPLGALRSFRPDLTQLEGEKPSELQIWARNEIRNHSVRMILEAGTSIASFDARRWVGRLDTPAVVVVTERDAAVDPASQLRLADAMSAVAVHHHDDGHLSPMRRAFGPAVTAGCLELSRSLGAASSSPARAAR